MQLNDKKKFECLKHDRYFFQEYSILPLRKKDMQSIRKWRNDQIDVLRQNQFLTEEDQIEYFNTVIKRTYDEKEPECMLFSLMLKNTCIGYGGLTNIDWISKSAEVSFLLDTNQIMESKVYRKHFLAFLNMIISLIFVELEFNRLFSETYDIRPLHIKILEEVGFKLERRLKKHVYIKGSFVDSLIHGFLRDDYVKKQKNLH